MRARANGWNAAIRVDLQEPILLLLVFGETDGMELVWDLKFLEDYAGFPTIWGPRGVERNAFAWSHGEKSRFCTQAAADTVETWYITRLHASRSNAVKIGHEDHLTPCPAPVHAADLVGCPGPISLRDRARPVHNTKSAGSAR